MIRLLIGAVLWAALALALVPGRAGAAVLPDDQGLAGRITAEAAGKTIQFPSLKTDVVADIQGDLATVTVTQTFVNPTVTALNAKYLFPLHKDAAVFAMTMEVGDEIVQAKIREREEARQTFEQGKREGKAAALLEQHRPNMFTQEIANLWLATGAACRASSTRPRRATRRPSSSPAGSRRLSSPTSRSTGAA
jgi:Ca-activated chloride channel homolog